MNTSRPGASIVAPLRGEKEISFEYNLLFGLLSRVVILFQMESETQQFLQERSERLRLLHERHERELEQYDEESARLGFR